MPGLKAYIRAMYPRSYSLLGSAKRFSKQWTAKHSAQLEREETFFKIYTKNAWGGDESRSGSGSSLEQTLTVCEQLPSLLKTLAVKSFLDAACGEFHWMDEIDLGVERYVGVDIVEELIENNRKWHADQRRTFLVLDIRREKLPKVDLIFCRDCLGHFSFKDIHSAVRNFRRSHSAYLLTTTFPKVDISVDIHSGSWRPLNLQLAPFNFPKPIKLINENCAENDNQYLDKSLGLWKISAIPRPGGVWEFLKQD
jgi:SAM-dependent methyltransferase